MSYMIVCNIHNTKISPGAGFGRKKYQIKRILFLNIFSPPGGGEAEGILGKKKGKPVGPPFFLSSASLLVRTGRVGALRPLPQQSNLPIGLSMAHL